MLQAGPIRERSTGISVLQRLGDTALIVCSLLVTVGLYKATWSAAYTTACVMGVAGYLLLAEFNGLYRLTHNVRATAELAQVATTWIVVVGGLLSLAFATKTTAEYSRVAITGWVLSAPVVVGCFRLVLRSVLKSLRARGIYTQTVAIAGCTPAAERLLSALLSDPTLGFVLRGVYDDRAAPRRYQGVERLADIIGDLQALVSDARDGRIDIVLHRFAIACRGACGRARAATRRHDGNGVLRARFFVFDLLHARWSSVGGVSVLSIFDTPFQGVGGWLKRLEDIVLGTIGLLMISPLMIAVAIGVRISSPGPIFFRQRRYGLSGREIYVLKFRTMTVCEDGANVQQAQRNDKRITPFGAFLRRTSLDELPQLFNVVGGSMSLVGPRPHAVAHNELYRHKIQGYMLRHKVKPGITGWAQVNGWRGETETIDKMEKRVEHDLYYIHNWRLSLDFKILFLTVFGSQVRQNAR
ncbi:MAG: undecaprenyl-phosphate glucose phosphotransferase [Polyangiaceae bacterium]